MNRLVLILCLTVGAARVAAQVSPYSGHTQREIKALSPDQIAGYLAGAGMGFALPAELNHYPGPKHVLHMAEQLELTEEQRQQTEAVFERMAAAARTLGKQVVDAEGALDALFAGQQADPRDVGRAVDDIAVLQGKLRYVHLEAHLAMKDILTAPQVHRYDELRGYADTDQ